MAGPNGASAHFGVNGRSYEIIDHSFDVVIVGAGGAGLRALVGCADDHDVEGMVDDLVAAAVDAKMR